MTETSDSGARGTIAVTGANGLLGLPLCEDLQSRGWTVRALARRPEAFGLPGIEALPCELPDGCDARHLEGADVVVHCAYSTTAQSREEAKRVNEEGTRNLLDASRQAGVDRFVFISSLAAEPDGPAYYARSKFRLEQLLDTSRDLALRPGLILAIEGHGRFRTMGEAMRKTGFMPLFGGGHQPFHTVHVDDVCEALARALDRELTGVLTVAEPEPLTMRQFLEQMAERLDVRCRFLPLPFGPALLAIRMIEALRLPFPLQSESLLGLKGMKRVDVSADMERLGMTFRSAEASLDDLLEPTTEIKGS